MRLLSYAATAVFGLALATAGSPAALAQDATAPDGVVATVDGVEITQEQYDIAAADLAQILERMPEAMRREYVLTYLTDLQLLSATDVAAEAVTEPDVQLVLDYARGKALIDIVLGRVGGAAATDEAVQALYDELVAENPPQQEVRARHILVETEDEARALKAEIDAGADFATLATENSLDPGSGQNGGDLGYFTADMMVQPFAETAFALAPGTVSDPVQTQFGWHLILVEDSRTSQPPTLDEIRPQLVEQIERATARDYLVELRAAADIETFGALDGGAQGGDAAPAQQ